MASAIARKAVVIVPLLRNTGSPSSISPRAVQDWTWAVTAAAFARVPSRPQPPVSVRSEAGRKV